MNSSRLDGHENANFFLSENVIYSKKLILNKI